MSDKTRLIRSATLLLGLTAALIAASGSGAAEGPPLRATPLVHSVPLGAYADNILSGGPPKDGIPSIEAPHFWNAEEADRYLDADDVVFGVYLHGEARAYPQRVLVWHEIVNDRFGDSLVSVTYCPLTGSALGFLRGPTTFGVSGRLVNSNLVMYDRATDSAWPQMLATAVSGPLAGASLLQFQVVWTTWARWLRRYPHSRVLSTDTGHIRDYQRDPYGSYNPIVSGYYAPQSGRLFPVMNADHRYPPKRPVIVVRGSDGAIAFDKAALRGKGILTGRIGGTAYTAVYDAALDTGVVFSNPEGRPVSPGDLRFHAGGVKWTGGVEPLDPVLSFQAMWFAFAAFYPDGVVVD